MATQLLKKLEYKEGMAVGHWPEQIVYTDLLQNMWIPWTLVPDLEKLDLIHIFCQDQATLEGQFLPWKTALKKDGRLWVSWPKKSSGVASDLDENILRDYGLANGLVDVKVASVDVVWSALKFVYRLKDRK